MPRADPFRKFYRRLCPRFFTKRFLFVELDLNTTRARSRGLAELCGFSTDVVASLVGVRIVQFKRFFPT